MTLEFQIFVVKNFKIFRFGKLQRKAGERISSSLILILVFDKSFQNLLGRAFSAGSGIHWRHWSRWKRSVLDDSEWFKSPHFEPPTFTRLAYLKPLLKPFVLDDRIWWCVWSLGRNLWCQSDSSSAISCLQDRTNCEECYFYQYFLYWCDQSDCRSCWTNNVCLLSILWSKEQGSTDSPQPKNFVWRPFGPEIRDKDNAMG